MAGQVPQTAEKYIEAPVKRCYDDMLIPGMCATSKIKRLLSAALNCVLECIRTALRSDTVGVSSTASTTFEPDVYASPDVTPFTYCATPPLSFVASSLRKEEIVM